jgi:hypothetical protein
MDADRFAALLRSLASTPSRRGALRLLASSALGGCLTLRATDGNARKGKGKKKKKKKRKGTAAPIAPPTQDCTPQCLGRRCGGNGCNGSCGACGQCQTCEPTLGLCPMRPDSDDDPCTGGICCGGACCPPTCTCQITGPLAPFAELLADHLGLPYPYCFAPGTGQTCGTSSSCPAGTTCETVAGIGSFCFGLCPGVTYPSI